MSGRSPSPALFWFRRDLRLDDNAGLCRALSGHATVIPVFIFDRTILGELPRDDRRVEFLWQAVADLKQRLQQAGSDLIVRHAHAETEIPALAAQFRVTQVYANEDYEPPAHRRDQTVADALEAAGVQWRQSKDTVIFAADDLLTQQGKPYTVFTPYKKAWREKLTAADYQPYPSGSALDTLGRLPAEPMPSLHDLGFDAGHLAALNLTPTPVGALKLLRRFDTKVIAHYRTARDFPAVAGVSFLSVYNRFGLISIRTLVKHAREAAAAHPGEPHEGSETWLSELIWRDFYFQFLYHHPRAATHPFKTEYERLDWQNDKTWFQAWCEGKTGYPLVDAAMIQLNTTGYMHNRLRMLTASFLTKDLLVDYRWGEAYFARRLLDFDMAANNGGWQWAASTGCDAQPYFRIFSPARQSAKFDPEAAFIKRYLPALKDIPAKYLHEPWLHEAELASLGVRLGEDYPRPIVDHAERRLAALAAFEAARKAGPPD